MITHARQKFTAALLLAMLAVALLLHPSPRAALHSTRPVAIRCGCASAAPGQFVRFKTT